MEWNVRLSEVASPDVLETFDATFEGYGRSREYGADLRYSTGELAVSAVN